ncbi:MAG: hypothetical protein ACKVT2_16995 [Saprospiraceae bacterium]
MLNLLRNALYVSKLRLANVVIKSSCNFQDFGVMSSVLQSWVGKTKNRTNFGVVLFWADTSLPYCTMADYRHLVVGNKKAARLVAKLSGFRIWFFLITE